jgi:hypothetical protein
MVQGVLSGLLQKAHQGLFKGTRTVADPSTLPLVIFCNRVGFLSRYAPQTPFRKRETGRDIFHWLYEGLETAKLRAGEPTSGVFPQGANPVEAAERGYRAIHYNFPLVGWQCLGGIQWAESSHPMWRDAHG